MVTTGNGAIGIVCDAVPVQPPMLTMTERTTEPLAPTRKVTVSAAWPEMIVPPVIVHAYAAPDCSATLAVLLWEFAQTEGGAVMTGVAAAVRETVADAEAPQPFTSVTVTP